MNKYVKEILRVLFYCVISLMIVALFHYIAIKFVK